MKFKSHQYHPRRSTRKTNPLDYYGEWINSTDGSTDPSTVSEAFSSSEKKLWKEAMQAEFQSLLKNEVWYLVSPPKDRKIISNKWVIRRKRGEMD